VSVDLLLALRMAHSFDPFPVRDDLGVYHVPFSTLAGAQRTPTRHHPMLAIIEAADGLHPAPAPPSRDRGHRSSPS
jgi:hypothetical protein